MSLVGRLEDLSLGDILQIIALSGKSGVLTLSNRGNESRIIFKNGQIISTLNPGEKENIASLLIREGVINLPILKDAVSHLRTIKFRRNLAWVLSERFGQDQDKIESAVRRFVEKNVRRLFEWKDGLFNFDLKETEEEIEKLTIDPLQPLLRKGISPPALIMPAPAPGQAGSPSDNLAELFKGFAADEALSPEGDEFLASVRKEISRTTGENLDLPRLGGEAGDEPVMASPGLRLLRSMVEELSDPNRYADISLLVLRFASEIMNRAVLLMVRKRVIAGLGQFGIRLSDGINPENRVREVQIPIDEISIFREVVENKVPIRRKLRRANPWEEYFLQMLGSEQPEESFFGPMISRGQVVIILYGDNLPERRRIGDSTGLEIFLSQAGLAMEKAFLERKLKEVPTLGKEHSHS